jgi:membrane protease YdiL (CAAX protease family)
MHFLPTPSESEIDQLMRTAHGAWLTALFGVLVAPVTEEIAFRGFLLPALATAYDWLALERTPAGLQRWQSSTAHTTAALIFAAIFSSVPFALLHAGQVDHAWAVLGVLFVVSLAFSYVRIATHSVACSTLMHATYNFTIFAALFVASGGFRHLDKLAN